MNRMIRPDAVLLPGSRAATGLEVCIEEGVIAEIRPYTAASRDETGFLLAPAFVNAHSHLEYRDFLGELDGMAYWDWIRELTVRKPTRSLDHVRENAFIAAMENAAAGVAALGEISDWPVSGAAMKAAGLSGRIYQEVITVREWESPVEKLETKRSHAETNALESGLPVHLSPHAPHTVEPNTLRQLASSHDFMSIHVAESQYENDFYLRGEGPIAEMYRAAGIGFDPPGVTPVQYLDRLDCLHEKTQLVHVCAITLDDIEVIAASGATVAHCPRSNRNLGCPRAPAAAMRKQGIKVGLGLDSPASSGPIDMFAEMRAALDVSQGELSAEDVWEMATIEAAASIGMPGAWEISVGSTTPMMLLKSSAGSLSDLIAHGPETTVRVNHHPF